MDPGLGLKIPIVEATRILDQRLRYIRYDILLPTFDNVFLRFGGNVSYWPDHRIQNSRGEIIFFQVEESDYERDLREVCESTVKTVVGNATSEEIKTRNKAVEDFLNCKLRLDKMPHTTHNPATCGVAGCVLPIGKDIPAKELLSFYSTHFAMVRGALQADTNTDPNSMRAEYSREGQERQRDNFSGTELLFGINVRLAVMPDVVYTPETQKAFEAEAQAKKQKSAIEEKLELIEGAIAKGLTASDAIDTIDLAMHPDRVQKKVIATRPGASVVAVDGVDNLLKGGK